MKQVINCLTHDNPLINKKLKELTTEEKEIYNKSLNKNVASFNSIYVCYKVIENNMWI